MIAKSLEISIALSISFENLDFAVGDWYRKLTQYSCQLILHCFCILNKLKNTTIKCRVDPQIPLPKQIEDLIDYIPENGNLK